jgi:hypothetical protein
VARLNTTDLFGEVYEYVSPWTSRTLECGTIHILHSEIGTRTQKDRQGHIERRIIIAHRILRNNHDREMHTDREAEYGMFLTRERRWRAREKGEGRNVPGPVNREKALTLATEGTIISEWPSYRILSLKFRGGRLLNLCSNGNGAPDLPRLLGWGWRRALRTAGG